MQNVKGYSGVASYFTLLQHTYLKTECNDLQMHFHLYYIEYRRRRKKNNNTVQIKFSN